jgi:uncharacterized membrane protein YraQ (UPF0718 family)
MKKRYLKKINNSSGFLIAILLIYLIILFLDKNLFLSCINFFWKIFVKILPMFALFFFLIILTNYFITPKFVSRHLKEKGIKKWFYIIIGGILSTGPIYMWYPLLADLKNKGLSYGLITCFLYNRGIKIPLLPLMIFYFSTKYVIILISMMILASIIQGILIDKIFKENLKK